MAYSKAGMVFSGRMARAPRCPCTRIDPAVPMAVIMRSSASVFTGLRIASRVAIIVAVRRILICAFLAAAAFPAPDDGFISLMPTRDIAEQWTAEVAPASIWSLRDGVIVCKGVPNGFLRSKKSYRNFVLRAEWRFEPEGWTEAPPNWPNAGFFIFAHELKDGWPVSLEVQGY